MKQNFGILFLAAFICFLAGGSVANGQPPEGMVKFTPDFRFVDGVFLNFDQVKANDPIPKAKLLTSTDYNDKDFFKNLFSGDKIYYYDGMGIRQAVDKKRVWGSSRMEIL